MGRKIKIDADFSNYIESLDYEVNARKSLCEYLMRNGNFDKEAFDYYHKEYIESFAKYELAKQELEKMYIVPIIKSHCNWRLDFSSCEVTIDEE